MDPKNVFTHHNKLEVEFVECRIVNFMGKMNNDFDSGHMRQGATSTENKIQLSMSWLHKKSVICHFML